MSRSAPNGRTINEAEASDLLGLAQVGSNPATSNSDRNQVLAAVDLEVSFFSGSRRVDALGPLSVSVTRGEFVSIVGPSGCGKSTLVKVIAGLIAPTAGRLDVAITGQSACSIATVFQDFGIFPWKTVQANVEFGMRVLGTGRKECATVASAWIQRLGLGGFEQAYPSTLSGGMRQRVAIARALAPSPEILLMDEPFASLDAQMRELLQEDLLRLSQEERRTVVFVTHSLEEAILLSDRVIVMGARPGRIIESTEVPWGRPRDTTVRELAEFGHLRQHLWEHLRNEVQAQIGESGIGGVR